MIYKKGEKVLLPQDLHIHTIFSERDDSVAPQQTIELIDQFRYAEKMGISDHFEHLSDPDKYIKSVKSLGFYAGTEVSESTGFNDAATVDFDYYLCHCRDKAVDYKGVETLLATGKPVIVAHPMALGADPAKLPTDAYLEINNRYIWRNDWRNFFTPLLPHYKFVIGSDAHQPHWLNQNIARQVVRELGIVETILF